MQDLAAIDTGRIQNWSITINNQVPEVLSFSWSTNPAGFSSSLQNPVANPATTTTYTVTLGSNAGCGGTGSVVVVVPEFSVDSFTPATGPIGMVIDIFGKGFTNNATVSIAGFPAVNVVFISSTHLQAEVAIGTNGSGTICVSNGNCSTCSNTNFTVGTSQIVFNIKLFIEGFYEGNGLMVSSVSPVDYPGICDTINVELHEVSAPHSVAFSVKNVIHKNGTGSFVFPSTALGKFYYIVVHHRNAIETWSAGPVLFNSITNFDFTVSKNKAYGNNQSDLGDGNFALFSGDISDPNFGVGVQDGVIESQDYGDMQNAVYITLLGYKTEDITGDDIVESSDYVLMENNVFYTRITIHP